MTDAPKGSRQSQERVLDKLEDLTADLARRRDWTKEEIADLEGLIKAWRGLMALGWMGRLVKPILVGVASIIGAMIAIRTGLLDLLGLTR